MNTLGSGTLKDFEEPLCELLDIPYSSEHVDEENEKEERAEDNEITKVYGMHFMGMAPEICTGYSRIRRFGNNQRLKINDYNILTEPGTLLDNNVYLRGKWRWDKEGIKISLNHKEKNPAIIFRYNKAMNVNIIIGSDDNKPAIAEVKIDNEHLNKEQQGSHIKMKKGISYIETTWPFIYNVIKTKKMETHKIDIIPRSGNFCFFTFVFG